MIVGILVPVSFFLTVFGIFYIFYVTRNKERLSMIEKGADPKLFKSEPKNNSNAFIRTVTTLGMLLVGVGLGIHVANVLEVNGMDDEAAYTSSIFLFGGLGLISSIFISKKLEKKNDD